jgi:hypothetical protein
MRRAMAATAPDIDPVWKQHAAGLTSPLAIQAWQLIQAWHNIGWCVMKQRILLYT